VRTSSPSRSKLDLHELRGVHRKRRALGGRHDRLAHLAYEPGEHEPPRRIELGQNIVQKQERLHIAARGEYLRLGEEQREDGQALFAL
jgi:hypothetical protein